MDTGTVLILGARGRLGQALVSAFRQAGWRVLAHRRAAATGGAPPDDGLRWITCPVEDLHATVTEGVDVVVHAANPPYSDSAWRKLAPGLMDAAIRVATARDALLLFPGNVYNFGAGMPSRLVEDTPQRPTTTKGVVRVELEDRLRRAADDGLRSAVLRAGDFFGAPTGTWFDMAIAKRLPRGAMLHPGEPGVPTAWAYLPDLARAFVMLAERRAAIRGAEVFHFGGHSLAPEDWLDALQPLAEARGWRQPGEALMPARFPWTLVRLGGLVVPPLHAMWTMRYLWRTPHALDDAKLRALIGEPPRTPLARAAAESLALLHPPAPATGPLAA